MNYAKISFNDTVNGEGLRVTLWCQGCTHKCEGCHNQQLWSFNEGKYFSRQDGIKIIDYIKEHDDFIQGLSLLGGEPMDNAKDLIKFIKEFKKELPNKDIWVWSGYTFEEIVKDDNKLELLKLCDVLIDGKFIKELKNSKLKFKGSGNQRTINIQESFGKDVIILLDL